MDASTILAHAKAAIERPELDREGLLSCQDALSFVTTAPRALASQVWVDECLEKFIDSLMHPSGPPGELLAPMIRCLGVASNVARICLIQPPLPRKAPPATAAAAVPAPAAKVAAATTAAVATSTRATSATAAPPAESPALRWISLLCRVTDTQSALWAHVTHRDLGGLPSASSRGPKTLNALAADLVGAGCVDTVLDLLREPKPAPNSPGSSKAAAAADGDGATAAAAAGGGAHFGPPPSDSPEHPVEPALGVLRSNMVTNWEAAAAGEGRSGGEGDGGTAASGGGGAGTSVGTPSELVSVDLVEHVVVLVSQLVSCAAAVSVTPASGTLTVASMLVAQAIGRIEVKRVKRTDGQRLVLGVQRLQLLVPQDSPQAAWSGFAAVVPPRVAVAALSLASPILTLKLWGVKDLALLIGQANGLMASTNDGESSQAPLTVADAIHREGVPALLVGDSAHEEVRSLNPSRVLPSPSESFRVLPQSRGQLSRTLPNAARAPPS